MLQRNYGGACWDVERVVFDKLFASIILAKAESIGDTQNYRTGTRAPLV